MLTMMPKSSCCFFIVRADGGKKDTAGTWKDAIFGSGWMNDPGIPHKPLTLGRRRYSGKLKSIDAPVPNKTHQSRFCSRIHSLFLCSTDSLSIEPTTYLFFFCIILIIFANSIESSFIYFSLLSPVFFLSYSPLLFISGRSAVGSGCQTGQKGNNRRAWSPGLQT